VKKQKSRLILVAAELAKEWKKKCIYVKHEDMFRLSSANGDWHLTSDQKINRLIDEWLKNHPLMHDGYTESFVLSVRSKLKSSLNRNRPSTMGLKIFKAKLRETGHL